MRMIVAVFALAGLAGCVTTATKVATDVQEVDKPVPIVCTIEWPTAPRAYVELVQLTGDKLKDLVLIERAKEAELEERIAYELKLEAAARKCVDGKPP
jgi:hypothetical protein